MEVRYQLRYSPARPLDRTANVKRSYPATATSLTLPQST